MDNLRERRRAAGLTQSELARRSGVAQPNIAAYESGRRRPTAATLAKLDVALRPRPSQMMSLHKEDVVAVLQRHGMTNPRLFGSTARGFDRPDSDVDLLVDASPEMDLLDLIDAASELEALLHVPVDLITSRSLRPGHEIARTAVPL